MTKKGPARRGRNKRPNEKEDDAPGHTGGRDKNGRGGRPRDKAAGRGKKKGKRERSVHPGRALPRALVIVISENRLPTYIRRYTTLGRARGGEKSEPRKFIRVRRPRRGRSLRAGGEKCARTGGSGRGRSNEARRRRRHANCAIPRGAEGQRLLNCRGERASRPRLLCMRGERTDSPAAPARQCRNPRGSRSTRAARSRRAAADARDHGVACARDRTRYRPLRLAFAVPAGVFGGLLRGF